MYTYTNCFKMNMQQVEESSRSRMKSSKSDCSHGMDGAISRECISKDKVI